MLIHFILHVIGYDDENTSQNADASMCQCVAFGTILVDIVYLLSNRNSSEVQERRAFFVSQELCRFESILDLIKNHLLHDPYVRTTR